MVIGRNNTILALSGAIPFALSIIFAIFISDLNWKWTILPIALCVIISALSLRIIHNKKHSGQPIQLKIKSVSQVTSEIFGSFLAYVLPLVFAGMSDKTIATIGFSCLIYLILLVISNVVYPSWIFSAAGYRLYRVMVDKDIEILLLSKQNVFNICDRTINTVEIDNCCFMDIEK